MGLAVVLGGLGEAPARAEQPHNVRLQDAVMLAVRRNPALASARIDVTIAEAFREGARGLDDFVVDAAVQASETRNSVLPGQPIRPLYLREGSFDLALAKPIATGGRISLLLNGGYTLNRSAVDVDPTLPATPGAPTVLTAQDYSPSVQLKIEHSLLRGLGPDVARADQRRARARVDMAQAEREAAAAALLRDVVSVYWDLSFAKRELEIRQEATASAREQLVRVVANIDVGKQPASAAAEIRVSIAVRDAAALAAELALVARSADLARLCGIPPEASAQPTLLPADEPKPPGRLPNGPSSLTLAIERNPQLQAMRAQEREAVVDVDVTENGLLPQLDITLTGGPTGGSHSASDALFQMRNFKNYTVQAGLVFQQALGRHAARGARDAAVARVRKARVTETDIVGQISQAVAGAVAAASIASRQGEVLGESIEAASTDLQAEKARFEVGRSTSFDVLRRQEAVAEVQLALLRAKVDQLKALGDLQAATGEILSRFGVTLP